MLSATNLLANGDFSENSVAGRWDIFYYDQADTIPAAESSEVPFQGWDIAGPVELWNSGWVELDADENGPRSRWDEADLNPARKRRTGGGEHGSTSISQTITVEEGKVYALSFDFKGRRGRNNTENVLLVTVTGATAEISKQLKRGSGENRSETIYFTAAGTQATVKFADDSEKDNTYGTLIREIRLEETEAEVTPLVIVLELENLALPFVPPVQFAEEIPFEITLEDWRAFDADRENWLANMEPSVAPDASSYSDLLAAVESAETRLSSLVAYVQRVENAIKDATNYTKKEFLSSLRGATWQFDKYTQRHIEALMVVSQFSDGRLIWTTLNERLAARAFQLPFSVVGPSIDLIPSQIEDFHEVFSQVKTSLKASLDNLTIAEAAIKSSAIVAVGAATFGYGFTVALAAGYGNLALGVGGTLLASSATWDAGLRLADGQDAPEIFVGTLSDLSGYTSVYMGLYQEDPITGERVKLTPETRGNLIGSGAVQLILSIVGVVKTAGQPPRTVQTEVTIPNPFRPQQWAATAEGALVNTANGTATIPIAIPIPGTAIQVITGTLGASTPIVVYMTGRPDGVSGGYPSFRALKRALGPAGEGKQWHHIVEQSKVSQFGSEAINNADNVIAIPVEKHQQISAYYSSKQEFTDNLTVRKWLDGQSFEFQRQFGLDALQKFGM